MIIVHIRSFFLSLTVLLFLANTALAQEPQTLMPYLKGELYGFANSKGEIVIEPKYEYVLPFDNGFSSVRFNQKWGIIKQDGKVLLEPIADQVSSMYRNGLAVVNVDGKYGVINKKGKWIVPMDYEWIDMKSGFIQVRNDQKKAALFNSKGKMIVDFEYDYFKLQSISPLDSNLIVIQKNEQYGLIEIQENNQAIVKIAPQYESLRGITKELLVAEQNDQDGLINTEGEIIAPFEYEEFRSERGFIIAEQEISYKVKVKIIESDGIYSHRGRDEIDKEYDEENGVVYYFFTQEEHDNLMAIAEDYGYSELRPDIISMFSVLNNQGEVIVTAQKGRIRINKHFILSSADGMSYENETILYTQKGKKVSSNPFHAVDEVQEDLIVVKILAAHKEIDHTSDDRSEEEKMIDFYNRFKCGFMDSTGEWVLPPIYSGAFSFDQQRAPVRKGNKWALINKKGEALTEFKYDQLYVAGDNRYGFRQGKLWGLMDLNGTEIIPATYYAYRNAEYHTDYFGGFSRFSGLVFKNGKALSSKQLPGFDQPHTTMIDTNGVQLFPFKYRSIEESVNSLFIVSLKKHNRNRESYGLINSHGKVLIPIDQGGISWSENEQVFVVYPQVFRNKYLYYDRNGQETESPFKAIEQEGLRDYKLLPSGYYSAKYQQFTVYFTPEGMPLFEE
ncbi:MAG: WG repeat-containing protein [Crocinitomicaceae bacterium]